MLLVDNMKNVKIHYRFIKINIILFVKKIILRKSIMSLAIVNVLESLGVADWNYVAENKNAEGSFIVSAVQLLGQEKLDLHFEHDFVSAKLSDAENNKVIADLAKTLESVGAVNIKAEVVKLSDVAQKIVASYDIKEVPVKGVDALTTAIAGVVVGLVEMLSMPSMSKDGVSADDEDSSQQQEFASEDRAKVQSST